MGCRGVCCAAFPFPQTPEQLTARWDDVRRPLTEAEAQRERDDLYIADMLIELPYEDRCERVEQHDLGIGRPGWNYKAKMPDKPFYTCRHWHPDLKICTAYEDRPEMCKTYPYGDSCEHGCDYRPPQNVITTYIALKVREAARG